VVLVVVDVVVVVVVVSAGASTGTLYPLNRIRVGEPVPAELIGVLVAVVTTRSCTWAGVSELFSSSIMATTPATNGAAIDVPDLLLKLVLLVYHAETMSVPGAKTSTQEPKFEDGTLPSTWLMPPTVIANGSDAGEYEHASLLLFPAAATTETLSCINETTASLTSTDLLAPRLKFATAGVP
jgi:hypothetical protein